MRDLCEMFSEQETEYERDNALDLSAIRAGERAGDDEILFDSWECF